MAGLLHKPHTEGLEVEAVGLAVVASVEEALASSNRRTASAGTQGLGSKVGLASSSNNNNNLDLANKAGLDRPQGLTKVQAALEANSRMHLETPVSVNNNSLGLANKAGLGKASVVGLGASRQGPSQHRAVGLVNSNNNNLALASKAGLANRVALAKVGLASRSSVETQGLGSKAQRRLGVRRERVLARVVLGNKPGLASNSKMGLAEAGSVLGLASRQGPLSQPLQAGLANRVALGEANRAGLARSLDSLEVLVVALANNSKALGGLLVEDSGLQALVSPQALGSLQVDLAGVGLVVALANLPEGLVRAQEALVAAASARALQQALVASRSLEVALAGVGLANPHLVRLVPASERLVQDSGEVASLPRVQVASVEEASQHNRHSPRSTHASCTLRR